MEGIKVKAVDRFDVSLLKELVALEEEAFGKWGYNEWVLAPLIRYGKVFVLYFNEEIAGLAVFIRKWSNPSVAYLSSISVKESFRGQGLGSRFLKECLSELKGECEKVKLHVDPSNRAAYKIYFDHFGFEPIQYEKDEYGEGIDRIIMELELEPFIQELH